MSCVNACRVVLSCCVAATPLAPDYQRYLEPMQCVDVERLPRLPVAIEKGRVGRQVMLISSVSRLDCVRSGLLQVQLDFHNQVVELRRFLREAQDPPLRRLPRSLTAFTQEEITSAVLRACPNIDAQGLREYINAWRVCQVCGLFSCSV